MSRHRSCGRVEQAAVFGVIVTLSVAEPPGGNHDAGARPGASEVRGQPRCERVRAGPECGLIDNVGVRHGRRPAVSDGQRAHVRCSVPSPRASLPGLYSRRGEDRVVDLERSRPLPVRRVEERRVRRQQVRRHRVVLEDLAEQERILSSRAAPGRAHRARDVRSCHRRTADRREAALLERVRALDEAAGRRDVGLGAERGREAPRGERRRLTRRRVVEDPAASVQEVDCARQPLAIRVDESRALRVGHGDDGNRRSSAPARHRRANRPAALL